jgi:iron-sulfur cluster assembly protein
MQKAKIDSSPVITFSKNAAKYVCKLLRKEKKSGVRVQLVPGGCSALKYDFQFVRKPGLGDMKEEYFGLNVFIPRPWIHFLRGTSVDCVESKSGTRLTINNPNARSTPLCGKPDGCCRTAKEVK